MGVTLVGETLGAIRFSEALGDLTVYRRRFALLSSSSTLEFSRHRTLRRADLLARALEWS
jgi:hypothetical protein